MEALPPPTYTIDTEDFFKKKFEPCGSKMRQEI